jgi:hypothetical protein
LEQIKNDLPDAVQAETDFIQSQIYKKILEVIMSDKIELGNNPEPTTFTPLQEL